MVKAIFSMAGGIAIVAFILAVVASRAMLTHTKPGVPKIWFAVNGYAFFTGRNFEPEAEPARRLFVLCAIAFFAAVLTFAVFGAIGWPSPPPA